MNNRCSNKNETKSKCTVPFALPRRYSFSTINCITTKSEEFVFD